MSVDVPRVLERVRQLRAARSTTVPGRPRDLTERRALAGGVFVAGDRAFDTVSGELVEVISDASENVLVPAPQ